MDFREIYKKVRIFKINKGEKNFFKSFSGFKNANCYVGYGYIDHEAGFTEQVFCLAKIEDEKIQLYEINNDESLKMRLDTKNIDGYFRVDVIEKELNQLLKENIKIIDKFYETRELKKLRADEEIDEFRHSEFIDDVIVSFSKEGYGEEMCWVRLEKNSKNGYIGILLNEPDQDFGVHQMDEIEVLTIMSSINGKSLIANLGIL